MFEDAVIEYQDTQKHATNVLLLALIAFAGRIGCVDGLRAVQVPMRAVVHTVHAKLLTLLFSYTIGCRSSHAIEHDLRPHRLAAHALGLASFPDHSSLSRFYDRVDPTAVEDLAVLTQHLASQHSLARHLDGIVLVDLDSTSLVVSGDHFELAHAGYFPQDRGATGYQLSLACASNAGHEILTHFFDAGHVNTGMRAWDLLYGVGEVLGDLDGRLFLRGDRAYGTGAFMSHLVELGVGFLFKGRESRTAIRLLAEQAQEPMWLSVSPTSAVADIGHQLLPNCLFPLRTILIRTWVPRKAYYHYSYLVTTLAETACHERDVFHFYNERVTLEKLIERCKTVGQITHRPTHAYWGLKLYIALRVLAHNLLVWYHQHVIGEDAVVEAPTVFTLVQRLGRQTMVVEQAAPGTLIWYGATASAPVRRLLERTLGWLRQHTRRVPLALGPLRRIRYTWADMVEAIVRAGFRLGKHYAPTLCKT